MSLNDSSAAVSGSVAGLAIEAPRQTSLPEASRVLQEETAWLEASEAGRKGGGVSASLRAARRKSGLLAGKFGLSLFSTVAFVALLILGNEVSQCVKRLRSMSSRRTTAVRGAGGNSTSRRLSEASGEAGGSDDQSGLESLWEEICLRDFEAQISPEGVSAEPSPPSGVAALAEGSPDLSSLSSFAAAAASSQQRQSSGVESAASRDALLGMLVEEQKVLEALLGRNLRLQRLIQSSPGEELRSLWAREVFGLGSRPQFQSPTPAAASFSQPEETAAAPLPALFRRALDDEGQPQPLPPEWFPQTHAPASSASLQRTEGPSGPPQQELSAVGVQSDWIEELLSEGEEWKFWPDTAAPSSSESAGEPSSLLYFGATEEETSSGTGSVAMTPSSPSRDLESWPSFTLALSPLSIPGALSPLPEELHQQQPHQQPPQPQQQQLQVGAGLGVSSAQAGMGIPSFALQTLPIGPGASSSSEEEGSASTGDGDAALQFAQLLARVPRPPAAAPHVSASEGQISLRSLIQPPPPFSAPPHLETPSLEEGKPQPSTSSLPPSSYEQSLRGAATVSAAATGQAAPAEAPTLPPAKKRRMPRRVMGPYTEWPSDSAERQALLKAVQLKARTALEAAEEKRLCSSFERAAAAARSESALASSEETALDPIRAEQVAQALGKEPLVAFNKARMAQKALVAASTSNQLYRLPRLVLTSPAQPMALTVDDVRREPNATRFGRAVRKAQRILWKPALSLPDVASLYSNLNEMLTSMETVGRGYFEAKPPAEGVRAMGRLVLAFDVLHCFEQLFPGALKQEVMQKALQSFEAGLSLGDTYVMPRSNADVGSLFAAVLQTLKKGNRPNAVILVKAKKLAMANTINIHLDWKLYRCFFSEEEAAVVGNLKVAPGVFD